MRTYLPVSPSVASALASRKFVNALAMLAGSLTLIGCGQTMMETAASSTVSTASTGTNASTASPAITLTQTSSSSSPNVTITDATSGAVIYYTTDGSVPTTASTRYTVPITPTSSSGTVTVQALAAAAGVNSSVASATYTLTPLPTPVISPGSGTYAVSPTVTISDAQTSASIYYTTDGSTPTVSSAKYAGPFSVAKTQAGTLTVQAMAYAAGSVMSEVSQAQISINVPGALVATTTVSSGAAVDTIPTNFLGYSHEWTVAQAVMGDAAQGTNTIYRTLLGTLSNNMGGPMVLRIGGGSTDLSGTATAATVQPFNELASAANVQFILGVNLGSDNLSLARQQASTFTTNMSAGSLAALEIGNEPDGYSTNGLRSATYGYTDYLPQYQSWKQGILSVASTAPVAGPVLGTGYWITNAQTDVTSGQLQAGLVTQHKYVACYSATNPLPTNILLLPTSAVAGMAGVQPYVSAAHQRSLKFRMDEINSICGGGEAGISDTFSATLWAIDTMFEYASIGVDGVNWHSDYDDGAYDLFHFTTWNNGQGNIYYLAGVKPLFYGLLFFSEAAGKNAQLLNASTSTSANMKVWVTKDSTGQAHLVVINKEPSVSGTVQVTLPGYTSGSIVRLTANSYQATDGITIGGQTYDGSTDGTLQGTAVTEATYPTNGVWTIPVGAMSAVMVNLKP